MVSADLLIIKTADGSDTLFHKSLNQHYHSTFGALKESLHVFIETGFLYAVEKLNSDPGAEINSIDILEIGFGTGLNAFLTAIAADKHRIKVNYTSIEPFPVSEDFWRALNYPRQIEPASHTELFENLHLSAWNESMAISPWFTLNKIFGKMEDYIPVAGEFNLVYFDAFSPDVQPELWNVDIFARLHNALQQEGVLVTYSVKGTIVRALKSAGFCTEKLPGPPGKRHILRAEKKIHASPKPFLHRER